MAREARSLTLSQWIWFGAAWLVPFLVLGVPYFAADYSELESTGVVWGWGPLVLIVVALVTRLAGRVPTLLVTLACTSALVAIVMLRVVLDVAIDPTDHNLWPFELVIAVLFGGLSSLAGALAGTGIARLVDR